MKSMRPFHLAFPVYDIKKTIDWYVSYLNCSVGRKSKRWVDFNFYGHQISAHLIDQKNKKDKINLVDGKKIPSRHFGIILEMNDWKNLVTYLNGKKINYVIKPNIRFKGQTGEQATFFIKDPSNNVLEFKAFQNDNKIFEN
ncbi:MAG: glyoxalase [Candidatus Marinimicrobia bacterium]|nr:glyoxalase [Candidatus Neomarinimicrobiota bacterium]